MKWFIYSKIKQITRWTQEQSATSSGDYVYSYDAAGRLTSAVLNAAVNGLVTDAQYAYDGSDNRISEQRDLSIVNAEYNDLNQLTNRSGTPTGIVPVRGRVNKPSNIAVNGKAAEVVTNNGLPWTFSADVPVSTGTNQFSVIAKDGSGNATTNHYQVVVNGGAITPYTHDAAGNLLSDGAKTYTWDAENRLVKISGSGYTSEFVYDGQGRRVKEKINGALAKQWIWMGNTLAEERNGSNVTTKRFYAQGEEINGTPYFYTRDHLGSIREMTDSSGNVVAQYRYDSYGRKTRISGNMDSDFGYTGHYYHANSGLSLTLYRAYDPDTGRWLSRDTLKNAELEQGANLYAYVGNRPITRMDILGLETCIFDLAWLEMKSGPKTEGDTYIDTVSVGPGLGWFSSGTLSVQGELWLHTISQSWDFYWVTRYWCCDCSGGEVKTYNKYEWKLLYSTTSTDDYYYMKNVKWGRTR